MSPGSHVIVLCSDCKPPGDVAYLTIGGWKRPRCDKCGHAFRRPALGPGGKHAFHYWSCELAELGIHAEPRPGPHNWETA